MKLNSYIKFLLNSKMDILKIIGRKKELFEDDINNVNKDLKSINVMKENEIDCFDLTGGKLMYTKTKVKTALSKKHIMKCLEQYFSQDPDIKPDEVCNYILDNRTITENESIRHKPNK